MIISRQSAAKSKGNIMDYTTSLMEKHHPDAEVEFIEYNGHSHPVKYKCLKCGKTDERETGKNFWKSKYACKNCFDGHKPRAESHEKIEKLFQENPVMELIEFHGHEQCKVRCLRCGRILTRYAQNILKTPYFCSYCDIHPNRIPMSQEKAQEWLNSITRNEDFEILHFKNTTEKALIKCKKCGLEFERRIYNFNISRGCPHCDRKESIYERKVRFYLEENLFNFSEQKRFKECNNNRSSFDFCLYNVHDSQTIILIEVQGQQHYWDVDIFENNLEITQKRDMVKRGFCIVHNIPLIEIPYWDLDKIHNYLPIEKFNDYRKHE